MKIKIIVMLWIKGKPNAHEVIELDEERLLDILRGAKPSPFKTPVEKQYTWELREVNFK